MIIGLAWDVLLLLCILLKDAAEPMITANTSGGNGTNPLLYWTHPGSGFTVSPMYLKSFETCLGEHDNYCLNGICIFHTELKMPTCRCLLGYSGERCEHFMLNSSTQDSSEGYTAVGLGVGMLLMGIIAVIYCYITKRYKETKVSYKVCHEGAAV